MNLNSCSIRLFTVLTENRPLENKHLESISIMIENKMALLDHLLHFYYTFTSDIEMIYLSDGVYHQRWYV